MNGSMLPASASPTVGPKSATPGRRRTRERRTASSTRRALRPLNPPTCCPVGDGARDSPEGVVPVDGVEEDGEEPGEGGGAELGHPIHAPVERVHERDVGGERGRVGSARILVVVEHHDRSAVPGEEVEPGRPGVDHQDRTRRRVHQGGDEASLDPDERCRLGRIAETVERPESARRAGDPVAVVVVDDPPALGVGEEKRAGAFELLGVVGVGDESVGARRHHSTWSAAVVAVYRHVSGIRLRCR